MWKWELKKKIQHMKSHRKEIYLLQLTSGSTFGESESFFFNIYYMNLVPCHGYIRWQYTDLPSAAYFIREDHCLQMQ